MNIIPLRSSCNKVYKTTKNKYNNQIIFNKEFYVRIESNLPWRLFRINAAY